MFSLRCQDSSPFRTNLANAGDQEGHDVSPELAASVHRCSLHALFQMPRVWDVLDEAVNGSRPDQFFGPRCQRDSNKVRGLQDSH